VGACGVAGTVSTGKLRPDVGKARAFLLEWTEMRDRATYLGSCHCGAIKFEIDTDFPELTTCDCSICRRRNALMVRVHESDFRLLAGQSDLVEYRFHSRVARHFFCRVCGIYPFHRKRVTPDHFGVNVFCLEDLDPAGIPVRETGGLQMP
jgi:hypothetical protein